jgi:hypothetical protein
MAAAGTVKVAAYNGLGSLYLAPSQTIISHAMHELWE